MTYKVISSVKTRDVQTQNGNFVEYMMTLEGDAGQCAASILKKVGNEPPKTGETINGTIEQSQYGPKFKMDRQGFGGGYRQEDPEKQKSIERQNALTNAVNYCVAKAQMNNGKTKSSVNDYLSGKHVLIVATLFASYTTGRVTSQMDDADIIKALNGATAPKAPETPPQEPTEAPAPEPGELSEEETQEMLKDIPY